MKRDWQHGPEETYPEREERINILLEELHMSIGEGEGITIEKIAEYVGCEDNMISEIEASAFKKLRRACRSDDPLIDREGFQSLSARNHAMSAIMEILNKSRNPY